MYTFEAFNENGSRIIYADRYEIIGTTAYFYQRGSVSDTVENVVSVQEAL